MGNKRGQGMSTNAIILIILGIVVLVVLILGFTIGWNKILPILSSNNVDTLVAGCDAACLTGSSYDFCVSGRNLKADGEKLSGVTCNYLIEKSPQYGVSSCPSISCDDLVKIVEATSVDDLESFCEENGQIIQARIGDVLESHTCEM